MFFPSTIPRIDQYYRPESLEEAVALLASHGKEARVLSGGTDLVTLMRNHALAPRCVIDISRIGDLGYVRFDEAGGLRLGALATLKALEQSTVVRERYSLLHEAVVHMGSPTMRNQATVAGNICRASPAADTAGPLLCLEATVHLVGSGGRRSVPITEFFAGPGKTVLAADELVAEVRVPTLPPGTGSAFLKLMRVAEDLAKVSASAVLTLRDGRCTDARIALGAVGPTPLRARRAEAVLVGASLDDRAIALAAETAAEEIRPITDLRSTREYRRQVTSVLVSRAIRLCVDRRQ
ncbi:MAG: xanthine dehydrogenase family protein subunit M [Chloroflexi bacterium]|nr:xanthine dehydrogenase family protein subunit M [Chloroflexota bacterium]